MGGAVGRAAHYTQWSWSSPLPLHCEFQLAMGNSSIEYRNSKQYLIIKY